MLFSLFPYHFNLNILKIKKALPYLAASSKTRFLFFRDGNIFLKESRGIKSESTFIIYVIAIKWIMCVQEKIELSSMLQIPMWSSTKISGGFSLTTKIQQQQKIAKNFPGVAKGWHSVA